MNEQRDILLVPFPFSDQSGRKVRPVVVVSNNSFNSNSEDLIVVGLTSNISKDRYSILVKNKDLDEGKLHAPCCIKSENILKVDKEIIIKKIGKVKRNKIQPVIEVIHSLISQEN
ncbi:MAG: type II toxin-antitoxin system PemK/MazF family toxin [Nanoarchaeota archaeon]|nr:type II toxin-antitoxin system PemK/MazF family toxin [Nanoarchaeota archaeon]